MMYVYVYTCIISYIVYHAPGSSCRRKEFAAFVTIVSNDASTSTRSRAGCRRWQGSSTVRGDSE